MASASSNKQDLIILLLTLGTASILYGFLYFVQNSPYLSKSKKDFWIVSLMLDLSSYLVILVPGWLAFRYTKSSKYLQKCKPNFLASLIKCLFVGANDLQEACSGSGSGNGIIHKKHHQSSIAEDKAMSDTKVCLHLFACFAGLLTSYLTWGILQEKIMTQTYINHSSTRSKGQFSNSQFLVFINRFSAMLLAGFYIYFMDKGKPHTGKLE